MNGYSTLFSAKKSSATSSLMDPEDILELVKEGVIEPDQIEDFENLDPEIQEMVADGDLDMDDAEGL